MGNNENAACFSGCSIPRQVLAACCWCSCVRGVVDAGQVGDDTIEIGGRKEKVAFLVHSSSS